MDERNNAQRCDGLSPSSHAAAPPLAALDPPQLTTASPVNLHVVAGKAYVWEVEGGRARFPGLCYRSSYSSVAS